VPHGVRDRSIDHFGDCAAEFRGGQHAVMSAFR
jgi:hypothetical protein